MMNTSRKDIAVMTADERVKLAEDILIHYPLFKEILNYIADCHERVKKGLRAKCFFITGESGAGKSTIVDYYAVKYPRLYTETGVIIPVFLSKIISPPTAKGMVTQLLSDLGDPCPLKGSKVSQTLRLVKLIKDCKVEIILLDEFDLVDRDTDRVLQDAAKWLRDLVDATEKPIVIIGLPSSERVLRENSQIRRRFSARKDLVPFAYETEADRKKLRTLLYLIDGELPLEERSNLADPDIAFRMYCASHGLIGYIMKIICAAAEYAIRSNFTNITIDLLAEAYDNEISAVDPNKGNPFTLDMKALKKRPMEKFMDKNSDEDTRKNGKGPRASEVLSKRHK